MISSYEFFIENREECEAELIALQLLDETLEYDFDVITQNSLPF